MMAVLGVTPRVVRICSPMMAPMIENHVHRDNAGFQGAGVELLLGRRALSPGAEEHLGGHGATLPSLFSVPLAFIAMATLENPPS